jgi:hypothetical protein
MGGSLPKCLGSSKSKHRFFSPGFPGCCPLPLAIYGVSVGFATASLADVMLAEVPHERSGQASGVQSTLGQVGSALGTAALGTDVSVAITSYTTRSLERVGVSNADARQIADTVQSSAGTALPGLRAAPATPPLSGILATSLADATRTVGIIAACFVLAGRLTLLLIPRASDTGAPEAQDEKNPGVVAHVTPGCNVWDLDWPTSSTPAPPRVRRGFLNPGWVWSVSHPGAVLAGGLSGRGPLRCDASVGPRTRIAAPRAPVGVTHRRPILCRSATHVVGARGSEVPGRRSRSSSAPDARGCGRCGCGAWPRASD